MLPTAEDNCKEEVHKLLKHFLGMHVFKYAHTCNGHCIMQYFNATVLENVHLRVTNTESKRRNPRNKGEYMAQTQCRALHTNLWRHANVDPITSV